MYLSEVREFVLSAFASLITSVKLMREVTGQGVQVTIALPSHASHSTGGISGRSGTVFGVVNDSKKVYHVASLGRLYVQRSRDFKGERQGKGRKMPTSPCASRDFCRIGDGWKRVGHVFDWSSEIRIYCLNWSLLEGAPQFEYNEWVVPESGLS